MAEKYKKFKIILKDSHEEEPYYKLWLRVNEVRDLMTRAREKELDQYDIPSMQAEVLYILKVLQEMKRKQTANELSKWLLREPHSVSRIIARMEHNSLLTKNKGSDNKTEVNITLTEKGEQLLQQSLKRESFREIISALSEEESTQLCSYLEKLRKKALDYLSAKEERHHFL